jgi:predicted alpha/beta superfamily hydrolase
MIGSPSLWADRGLLAKASAFKAPVRIPVFLGVGADEQHEVPGADMTADARDLAKQLGDHASGLVLRFREFRGEGHVAMQPDFFSRGLRFALPPRKAPSAQSASPAK